MDNVTELTNTRLIEQQASEWVIKIERDEPLSEQEVAELHEWIARSPRHKAILFQMADTWNDMDVLSGLVIPLDSSHKNKSRGWNLFKFWCLAPFILLCYPFFVLKEALWTQQPALIRATSATVLSATLVAVSWWVSHHNDPTLYTTPVGQQMVQTLEDGSQISLNSDSQLQVHYTEQARKLYLIKGEAFFDVQPDKQRPFEVYVNNRMVRAVGTAFSVRRELDKIEVMVTEGKVDLATIFDEYLTDNQQGYAFNRKPRHNHTGSPEGASDTPQTGAKPTHQPAIPQDDTGKGNGEGDSHPEAPPARSPKTRNLNITHQQVEQLLATLEAGQSTVIHNDDQAPPEKVTTHQQSEMSRKLSWREGRLVFAGESLQEVVQEVSRYTNVKIEVSDPSIKDIRIGGQFQVGETDALFDVLETGFGIRASHVNDNYVRLFAKNNPPGEKE